MVYLYYSKQLSPIRLRHTVYVTIISKKDRVICSSYEITENRSVIVDKDGYVQRAMYKTKWQMGSNKIWTDMNGIEHYYYSFRKYKNMLLVKTYSQHKYPAE